ncbi:unnamed protein product, partial [Cuscuta europaea]
MNPEKNWLSFPLSPTEAAHSHPHFSFGLLHPNSSNTPFQNPEWNFINTLENEVPRVAEDFLGIGNTATAAADNNQPSDLVASYHGDGPGPDDYIYPSDTGGFLPLPFQIGGGCDNLDPPESACNVTLSMGSSGKGSTSGGGHAEASPSATTAACGGASGGSNTSIVEAATHRRALESFGQRTSIYRGVTRHRWTGRYEAHLWDNSCRREGQSRKGRQVYL